MTDNLIDPAIFIGVQGKDIISFGSGQPDLPPPEETLQVLPKFNSFKYGLIQGNPNLRENVSNNISKKISETKFDLISCQFAIHYFLETEKIWNNFFKNIPWHNYYIIWFLFNNFFISKYFDM